MITDCRARLEVFINSDRSLILTLIFPGPTAPIPSNSPGDIHANLSTMDAHLIRLQPHTFPALTSSSNSSNDVYPLAMPSNPNSAPSFPAKKPLSILTSLEIEPIDPTVFRSQSLWTPAGARGAFGGQVIAQALNAAAQTVGVPGKGGEWTLHSQHVSRCSVSYFFEHKLIEERDSVTSYLRRFLSSYDNHELAELTVRMSQRQLL
jgi:hypothetical protein